MLAAETAKTLFPYEDPLGERQPSVKLGGDYYTVIGVTKERASSAGDRRQPRGPGLQQGRLHPAEHLQAPVRRADHRHAVRARWRPRRRSSRRSRSRSASIDEVARDRPDHRGGRQAATTPRRTSTSSSPTTCCCEAQRTARQFSIILGTIAVDLAAGRRHRDHEHHAGDRHRADPRDRHPPRPGGQAARHHPAVPDRDGRALRRRRRAGRGASASAIPQIIVYFARAEGGRHRAARSSWRSASRSASASSSASTPPAGPR